METRAVRYQSWETVFVPESAPDDPFRDGSLRVEITDPYGDVRWREGFWDGGVWRLRWIPLEEGPHHFRVETNLDGLPESFGVVADSPSQIWAEARHALSESGPIRIADDRLRFARHDGEPCFLNYDDTDALPGTATDAEWVEYVARRRAQGFGAVAFATEPLQTTSEDRFGRRLYDPLTGTPDLSALADADHRIRVLNAAGLVAMPILFSRSTLFNEALETEEYVHPWKHTVEAAIRIGRHLVARWGAYDVAWRLDLPVDPEDPVAMIEDSLLTGRGIFGDDLWRAPVGVGVGESGVLHETLLNEPWIGWLADNGFGLILPSAKTDFARARRPIVGFARHGHPAEEDRFRRGMDSQLFAAPPAGIGTKIEEGWALRAHGRANGVEIEFDAEQWDQEGRNQLGTLVGQAARKISRHHWSDLSPAPEFVPAAVLANSDRSMIRAYLPNGGEISLPQLSRAYNGYWISPRVGEEDVEIGEVDARSVLLSPTQDDWILELDAADGF